MNLVYFLRVLYRRSGLIIGIALLMAGIVFVLTCTMPKTYTSSSTLYTGIATGFDIESGANTRFDALANNAQFDNLINIFKSRETQEKTAIQLMAQHLLLTRPDPRYCLPETWKALMVDLPADIKRMVEDSYLEKPDETPQIAAENITRPDTVLKMITEVKIPDNICVGDPARYRRLVKALTLYKDANQDNYIFNTLQSSNPFYGVQKISSVKVSRIQSSDLLKLTFDSDDPAVCMQTLKILTEVFRAQYQGVTERQTGLVSDYFRKQVTVSKSHLDSLEQKLLEFRMKNRIINYDEQTKFISEQKELLDKDWYEEAGRFSAAQTALALIEQNLDEKGKSALQNNAVMEKRRLVYQLALRVSMEEVKDNLNVNELTRLRGDLIKAKKNLNDEVQRSFEAARTSQGLNIQSVLQKWFEKAIEVEESQAKYKTLTEHKNFFLKKYDEFAPLGSQLKKLEREIDLAQQNYMSHLNNLNQSILKQKNVEQSDIQIIDNPIYPIKPNASKRMLAVIAAFLVGLVMTASLIIFMEFMDSSIKFPEHLEELSGLKLLGAYPLIPLKPNRRFNDAPVTSRAIDQLTQRIKLENLRQNTNGDQPFMLFMVSTREREGKTYLATRIVEKLRATGLKVLYVKPLENYSMEEIKKRFSIFDQPTQSWDFEYAVPDNFISIRNMNELLKNYSFMAQGYQYLIIELPALLLEEYPATLIKSGNLSVLVARATRNWNSADHDALERYRSNISHPILSLLNGCSIDQLESTIGEMPGRYGDSRKCVRKRADRSSHAFRS